MSLLKCVSWSSKRCSMKKSRKQILQWNTGWKEVNQVPFHQNIPELLTCKSVRYGFLRVHAISLLQTLTTPWERVPQGPWGNTAVLGSMHLSCPVPPVLWSAISISHSIVAAKYWVAFHLGKNLNFVVVGFGEVCNKPRHNYPVCFW